MSHTYRDDAVASAPANAFLALSRVYLEGVESLTSLNLNAAREAVESYALATTSVSEAKYGKDYGKFLPELGQPMFEKAVNHSRNMYGIIAKTQEELSTVIKEQFAHPPMAWVDLTGGNTRSAIFTRRLQ